MVDETVIRFYRMKKCMPLQGKNPAYLLHCTCTEAFGDSDSLILIQL